MSADTIVDLDQTLLDALEPVDAPSDDDVFTAQRVPDPADDEAHATIDHVATWRPSSAEDADWLARKASRAQQTIDSLQAQRDRIVAQADAWLAHERTRHDAIIEWASGMLRLWLEAEIRADDSSKPRKSRTLPCGVAVKMTSPGTSVVVEDEPALVAWLQSAAPEAVEFVANYSKADVKRLLTKDGLAVAGVTLVTGEPGFKADLGGAS